MVSILSVGCAYPDGVIHNDDLLACCSSPELEAGLRQTKIKARRTVLPLSYLKETGNAEPLQALSVMHATPTDLGAKAAAEALQVAGLSIDQIGLVVGDSSTALETAPSAGQRVAGAIGLKGPAYDITGATCSLALHIDSISKWKAERLPEFIMSVSTNTTTLSVNYRSGSEAAWFGDAASVAILSTRDMGKLKVENCSFTTAPRLPDFMTADIYKHINLGERPSRELVESWLKNTLKTVFSVTGFDREQTKVIASPLFADQLQEELLKEGFMEQNFWSNSEFFGDSLGSYSGCVLSEHWSEIDSESQVLILQIGAGVSFGHLFMKA